jgi:hypothetical protein
MMWNFQLVTMMNLPAPPSIRKKTPMSYKSLMQYQRRLKDRHEKTLAKLESLKCDHSAQMTLK